MIEILDSVFPSPELWEIVIKGIRNAFKSTNKSDSEVVESTFSFGEKDRNLLNGLINEKDPSHRKALRQLPVVLKINAPLFWWRQMDKYQIGTVTNSESQMHTLLKKPFEISDFSFENIPGYKKEVEQAFVEFNEKELQEEKWVDLNNGYKVSSLGRVTGLLTDYLKPVVSNDGYVNVTMKGKIYRLSRIVAEQFCDKPPEANVVNHINGNKLDNRASNLEWVTQGENIKHSYENNLQPKATKHYKGKFTSEERNKILEQWESGEYSKREIANMWNVSHTCINEMINGKHKYRDDVNVFEKIVIPLIQNLNELRDMCLEESDEEKKKEIWDTILKLVPQSFNQARTWSGNYENLRNIYHQRKGHKLQEWEDFRKWIEDNVPYAEDLIVREV